MDKVCFDASKMQNMQSGLGQFCFHLASAIQNHPHHYTFKALVPDKLHSTVQYPFSTQSILWYQRYLTPVRAQVLHCTHQESYFKPAVGCKMVLTIHDLNFLHRKLPAWKQKLRLWKIQKKIDASHTLVFISEYVKNECARKLSFNNKPTHVIYNGVPHLGNKLQKPKGIPEEPFLFSIGVMQHRKNFAVLIDMLPYLPGFNLVIAGQHNKSCYPELLQLAKTRGISERVFFSGAISDEERHWLYAHCRAFVFPSLAEGFGLPVVEAFSLGKPVVLSKFTSLPEIGGKYAHYFDDFEPRNMAAAVNRAMLDNAPEKQEARKKYAAGFSWEKAALAYHELYQSLLKL